MRHDSTLLLYSDHNLELQSIRDFKIGPKDRPFGCTPAQPDTRTQARHHWVSATSQTGHGCLVVNVPFVQHPSHFVRVSSAGLQGKAIASLCRESKRGFSTSFYAKDPSDVTSVPTMRDKIVGINGFNTAGHLWLIAALKKNNMTDKDVKITPIGFPAMQESLRAGVIDVGMFPQPFAAMLEKQDKVTKIFDAKYGVPFDEELVVLMSKEGFLKNNIEAIKGFLVDLKAANDFYLSKMTEARQILLDAKMVRADPVIGTYAMGTGEPF